MKTDLFQSCGHCWVFQICWHIECSTFTASSFRIWNSSTRIPSPPLALFVVMLPKAHLTSRSRMSGSGWVITPSWLSGLWRYLGHGNDFTSEETEAKSICSRLAYLLTQGIKSHILFLLYLKKPWLSRPELQKRSKIKVGGHDMTEAVWLVGLEPPPQT